MSTDSQSLYPITGYPRALKIVFSNLPAVLNGLRYRIFPPNEAIEWYPENYTTLEQLTSRANGGFISQARIIVTNSPLLLKAFQAYQDEHPLVISFYCVEWKLDENGETQGDYLIQASNKLDFIPCPVLRWEEQLQKDIDRIQSPS